MPIHLPEHDPLDFSLRLKEAMADVGMNTGHGAGTDLARRHKTSAVSANAWLKGTHMPSPERVKVMAADCGVRFEWLYFGQPPKRNVKVAEGSPEYSVDIPLTPEELALVRNYRASDEALRSLVDAALAQRKTSKAHKP